jgi:hypothetical protein
VPQRLLLLVCLALRSTYLALQRGIRAAGATPQTTTTWAPCTACAGKQSCQQSRYVCMLLALHYFWSLQHWHTLASCTTGH